MKFISGRKKDWCFSNRWKRSEKLTLGEKWKGEMGERKEAHRYREQISGSQRQEVKWRQKGKGGQKVQTSSYKIMNSRECNM